MTNDEWRPTAAYLYILHLDPTGLAWEYLRRNPLYRSEWAALSDKHSAHDAERWGLQFR